MGGVKFIGISGLGEAIEEVEGVMAVDFEAGTGCDAPFFAEMSRPANIL